MNMLKEFITIIILSVLTLHSFSQPIEKHLKGKQICANHYWSKCVIAGRANEGLRASWLEQLDMVHKSCGFEYVRFHGLFHENMIAYNVDKEGKPVYTWQYIDDLFDRLFIGYGSSAICRI